MGCRFWFPKFHHEIDLGLGHSSQKAFSRIQNNSTERGVGYVYIDSVMRWIAMKKEKGGGGEIAEKGPMVKSPHN